ncbi:unnamed protein product [Cyclocybe aegerita]|uniref:Uncharacterized protein n=1 Tax=Cyclocybe aegerita TaxID=1973307 RepID=A0A8S0XQR5_CYCAE|nr:unnamed protein product [Cyclocybe aegerita]
MDPPSIPLEITEQIIDVLASENHQGSAIKACATVSRDLLAICRKHLFSIIHIQRDIHSVGPNSSLSPPHTIARNARFVKLITATPAIADYVRTLDYAISRQDRNDAALVKTLEKLTRLQCLKLRLLTSINGIDWGDPRMEGLRSVFFHLTSLPTFTDLSLDGPFYSFPFSLFASSPNLKSLSVSELHISDSDPLDEFKMRSNIRPALLQEFHQGLHADEATEKLLRCPFLDFTNLTKVSLTLEEETEEYLKSFVQRLQYLTLVHMDVSCMVLTLVDLAKITASSRRSLKVLSLEILCPFGDEDPLLGLCPELEKMADENVLESILIDATVSGPDGCRTEEEWGRLSEVLMKEQWSCLRQVTLSIAIAGGRNPELEAKLDKLPFMQLAELRSTERFKFEYNCRVVED